MNVVLLEAAPTDTFSLPEPRYYHSIQITFVPTSESLLGRRDNIDMKLTAISLLVAGAGLGKSSLSYHIHQSGGVSYSTSSSYSRCQPARYGGFP